VVLEVDACEGSKDGGIRPPPGDSNVSSGGRVAPGRTHGLLGHGRRRLDLGWIGAERARDLVQP